MEKLISPPKRDIVSFAFTSPGLVLSTPGLVLSTPGLVLSTQGLVREAFHSLFFMPLIGDEETAFSTPVQSWARKSPCPTAR